MTPYRKHFFSILMLGVCIHILLALPSLHACTGIKLVAKDGASVHGRTLEFGIKIDTAIAVIPRGYSFTGTTSRGKGLTYKAKYAALGTIAFDQPLILDGINEKGLSIGTFYFPGYAKYVETTPNNQDRALSPLDFPNWILSQFATVKEAQAALNQVVITNTSSKDWGNDAPPFHYIVYDTTGGCIVIEPINGTLISYENKVGTLTNSPEFPWHMTYLRNFINLRTVNVPPFEVDGLDLSPFGQGSGMVGLPGDFTPPSRFVRAAIFSYTALPSENVHDAIFQLFHILNQFDIPIGIARQVVDGVVHTDYTMITCARDPHALKYYFKTYQDQTIRMVDLNQFDLNAPDIKKVETMGNQVIVDISRQCR